MPVLDRLGELVRDARLDGALLGRRVRRDEDEARAVELVRVRVRVRVGVRVEG